MEQFEIENNTLIKYNGDEKIVTIPSNIEVIGKEAFMGNTSLYLALFPDSLKEIGSGAFKNCTNLSNVKLPSNIEIVGAEAFSNCTKLFDAELNEGLEYLGPSCFEGCSGLFEVNIPGSIKIIRMQTFFGCTKLKYVNISEGIERINTSAFDSCKSLKNIILPKSLEVIENSAFGYCSNLEYVCIPENVTEMDSCIFYECENLKKVDIKTSKIKVLPSHTFYNCNSLTEVNIAEGVEVIEWGAFEDCYNLKALTLPSTLTTISEEAFENCNLKNIKLPSTLKELGHHAFSGNNDIKIDIDKENEYFTLIDDVIYSKDGKSLVLYPSSKTDSKYVVESGVENIKKGAFVGNVFLEEIVFSKGVRVFESGAIKNLDALRKFNIPESADEYALCNEFDSCPALSEIYIENKNHVAGDLTFCYCCGDQSLSTDINLKFKGIPSSYDVFSGHQTNCKKAYACGYVYAIDNGYKYTDEDNKKFREYIKLYRKTLISYIEEYNNLLTYMIKNKILDRNDVKKVLEFDFVRENVELKNELLTYASEIDQPNDLDDIQKQMKIIEDFAATRKLPIEEAVLDWEFDEYDKKITISRYIGNNTDVIIPRYIGDKAVISIGEIAFDGNELIKSVEIPETLEKIGVYAFLGCSNLTDIVILCNPEIIEDNAFIHCDNIQRVTLNKKYRREATKLMNKLGNKISYIFID